MSFKNSYNKVDVLALIACVMTLQIVQPADAAVTDIANSPLFTSSVNNVKSNIMFIFDDSGSMDEDSLPDDAQSSSAKYGYKSYQCNGVGYNPSITYTVPIKADGTSYPAATFAAAKKNGFSTSSGSTTNLSTASSSYYYKYTGSQSALSYTYSSSSALNTTSTFYKECNSDIDSAPGSDVFEKVDVTIGTSAVKQNYANWYSYYRTRLLMMKSSVGLAFSTVDSKYRVGFNIIGNKSASGASFLDIKDFDDTQKSDFYTKLYSVAASGYTPLRGALSRAGQYFANKAPGQTSDPTQYSCQKNFSILSTDGYWNTNEESTTDPKYGPYQIDNTTDVGQQDGPGTLRPMLDGTTEKITTTKKWNVTDITEAVTATPKTLITKSTQITTTTTTTGWSRTNYTLGTLATNRTNSSLTACTTLLNNICTITVVTSTNHGYVSGDTVTIAGASPNAYNGTYIITRISNSKYTYAISSIPGADTAAGTSGKGSCPGGQGILTAQPQARNKVQVSTDTSVTTTTQIDSSVSTKTTTAVTPYTETIVTTNGIITSDTTATGLTSPTSATIVTTVPGIPVVGTPVITTVVGAISNPSWSNNGSASTSCAAILPSPNPSTEVGPNSSSAAVATGAPTVSGPTVTNGTAAPAVVTPISTTLGTVTTTIGAAVVTGASTNSLADVAMYYYKTDLRDPGLTNCTGALGTNVCDNNVAGGGRDIATYQHMTTFTLGLGNSGTLQYDPKYLSQSSGDYFDILQGTKNWPTPNGNAANIDDLWHAAVDGRGQFFSASEPQALTVGLNNALDSIKAITGSASAAATSTLQPVQGNNDIYIAQFTSAKWTGDVLSYKIEPSTGIVATTASWSAQAKLDALSSESRKIYYQKSGVLRDFDYVNLTADGMQGNFDNFCSKTGAGGTTAPAQCSLLNVANNTIANTGANLVNYLRGTQSYANDLIYRSREHVLGDVINASPLFVGKPSFKYGENGYSSFINGSNRSSVIYAAANDGMLHAFDGITGDEKWAYIPSFVMPNMYKLGDTNYPNNHVFMVDGAPVVGDIYINSEWKTILVGGLNSGGRGYYALDVTDPALPKLLWEFSETDLGYTFGNPIITKKNDGTWVVVFSSGYNNVNPGDGNGHLYMLDANTGEQLLKLDTNISGTGVGSIGTPSGLGKINSYVESDADNTTKVIYGGDLLGNIWRFDIDSVVKPYLSAMRLAELKIGTKAQPITSRPAIAQVNYNGVKYKVIYVGTGKYLGTSDLANTDTQTIYALKDNWTESGLGEVRTATSPAMVVQTASTVSSLTQGSIVKGTANAVNWTVDSGWYMDFISSGERVNINPLLVLNALYVGTNVPKTDACTVGGTSWLYKLDIAKGTAIPGSSEGAIAISLGNVLIMGMTNIQLTTRNVATIVTRSDGTVRTVVGAQPTSAGPKRRTSWRVLK